MQFDQNQKEALNRLKPGSILVGGTGSGKSRTALAYYYIRECGGMIEAEELGRKYKQRTKVVPLYIITTAAKRDKKEWEQELIPFMINEGVIIDSWNNIKKYAEVKDAFFIFDEPRVVGSGAWSKTFIKISKSNRWILLSATPGDTYSDYIPVFIANGFYKNRTQFAKRHIVFSRFTNYPKIERYLETDYLDKLKASILVDMRVNKSTIPHRIDVVIDYDKDLYSIVSKDKWNPYEELPIENASQFVNLQRRICNSDKRRVEKVKAIAKDHKKVIVFYTFDYELELLRTAFNEINFSIGEWNGHNHTLIPEGNEWAYLVQYNAGSEGWNCITTDTIIFYSLCYSYRMIHQAAGRIDRRNTTFKDLYYYYLYSNSSIDKAILRALDKKKDFNEKKYLQNDASQKIQVLLWRE